MHTYTNTYVKYKLQISLPYTALHMMKDVNHTHTCVLPHTRRCVMSCRTHTYMSHVTHTHT